MDNGVERLEKQIEILISDYLNTFDFRIKDLSRKKYFTPLIGNFDFFHQIIFIILKKTENKQKINLICNGLFILALNVNFILGNEMESQLLDVIKSLDVDRKSIFKNLILFSGAILSNVNMCELVHGYDFGKFKNNFKKALKDLKIDEKLATINKWPHFCMSWNYVFRINDDKLSQNPKEWFLSLAR